jgi:hypothetical protein
LFKYRKPLERDRPKGNFNDLGRKKGGGKRRRRRSPVNIKPLIRVLEFAPIPDYYKP